MAPKIPDGQRYDVVYSALLHARLKALAGRARQRGKAAGFHHALKIIDASLHEKPETFGDPYYHLLEAHLTFFARILKPLHVTYAVHQQKPVVFVHGFQPFPPDAF